MELLQVLLALSEHHKVYLIVDIADIGAAYRFELSIGLLAVAHWVICLPILVSSRILSILAVQLNNTYFYVCIPFFSLLTVLFVLMHNIYFWNNAHKYIKVTRERRW
jgi:hypothetical protein